MKCRDQFAQWLSNCGNLCAPSVFMLCGNHALQLWTRQEPAMTNTRRRAGHDYHADKNSSITQDDAYSLRQNGSGRDIPHQNSRITTLDVGKARNGRTPGQGKSSHELNPKKLKRSAQLTRLVKLWVVVASSTHKSEQFVLVRN